MAEVAVSNGRVVVLTGATGLLGGVLAGRFADRGDRLVLLGRSIEHLAAIRDSLPGGEERHATFAVDLSSGEDAVRVAAAARAQVGRAAVLLHAVGGYRAGKGIAEAPADEIDEMLNAHARSTFNVLRAFLPDIREADGGRIVTFSSSSAQTGSATGAAYAAAKAALEAITMSVARELAATNATANVIAVRTIGRDRRTETTPESIAATVEWLCSPAAATVNGARIAMHGRA